MVETGPTLVLIDRRAWWALAAPPLFVGIDGRGGWAPLAPPLPSSMVMHGGHWLLPSVTLSNNDYVNSRYNKRCLKIRTVRRSNS